MSKPATTLHFGIRLTAGTPHFLLYDNSASVTRSITMPAELYFYKYSNNVNDFVQAFNTAFTGYASLSRTNDRQVTLAVTDTNDYIYINSASPEAEKIASMLGWYDNTGDLTYCQVAQMRNGYVSQVTLSSWYSSSGKTYDTPDIRGIHTFDAVHVGRQDGYVAALSGLRRTTCESLMFTAVDQDDVRHEWDYGTQATLWTTLNATWTASLWRAYDPTLHEPCFYGEIYEDTTLYSGRWYLVKPIVEADCKPTVNGWSGLFNLSLSVVYGGDAQPEHFGGHATLSDGLLAVYNLQDNAGSTYVTDATARTSGTASTNTSTLYNAAGVLSGGSFAFRGGASNDYVTLNNLEAVAGLYIDYGKPFSVSMWVKPDSVTGLQLFWGNGPFTRLTSRIQLLAGGAKVGYIFAKDTASNYVLGRENVGVLSIGAWTHIVMTYNGGSAVTPASGNVKLYCGAALKTLEDWGTTGTVNGSCAGYPFYLGMYPGDTSYDYDGYLQQVCIWSRALTAAEVASLYNSGSGLAY